MDSGQEAIVGEKQLSVHVTQVPDSLLGGLRT